MAPDIAAVMAGACIVLHKLAIVWKMPLDDDEEDIEDDDEEDEPDVDAHMQDGAIVRQYITQNTFMPSQTPTFISK